MFAIKHMFFLDGAYSVHGVVQYQVIPAATSEHPALVLCYREPGDDPFTLDVYRNQCVYVENHSGRTIDKILGSGDPPVTDVAGPVPEKAVG